MKALLILLAGAALAASPESPERVAPGAFRARLPEAWRSRSAWSGPVPAYVFSRIDGPPPETMISVERYEPGNPLYASSADYLKRLPAGGKVSRGGRLRCLRKTVDVVERAYDEDGGSLRERIAVCPAAKGFWVVKLKAGASRFKAAKGDFDALVSSLRLP